MRSHSNKACWNQQQSERAQPFSSSRQTTPVQNPIQQLQAQNYGEQGNQQNPAVINHMETASKPWENKLIQMDHYGMELQHGSIPQQQVHYQKIASTDYTTRETNILQQQVRNEHERKITKTQATQVNEMNEHENYYNRDTPNRLDHQKCLEEECLRKEHFFVNHYYSHPAGQCCCQQQGVTVRRGETMIQSSVGPTCEKGRNLQKLLQFNEDKINNGVTVPLSDDVGNEYGTQILHCKTKGPVIEPQVWFTQAYVLNQMNTSPLAVVDTTVPPPLMTKKERDDSHMPKVNNTATPQKDEELLKVVQTVAQSLQQQIVLGMCTTDMSQQRTDALIGELIKSHNRRDMNNVLNNIPTFNGLEPEKCMDWAT